MTSWKKIYVVGDKKKKNHENSSEQKEKSSPGFKNRMKAFFGKLFRTFFKIILVIGLFLAGLFVGFVEDNEFEDWVNKPAKGIPSQIESGWKAKWETYEKVSTWHYECRLECRGITQNQVDLAVRNGELINYNPNGEFKGIAVEKFKVSGPSALGADITVVFSPNDYNRKITLITAWNNDGRDNCESDCKYENRDRF